MKTYFDEFDQQAALRTFPIGDAFLEHFRRLSRDELRAGQEAQFERLMARGWQVPFYQRLWRGAGIEPGDVRSLDDLPKLPTYTKGDLMQSIGAHPPYGDFHGMEPGQRVIMHTTSGTTGRPQTLLFGPTSREIQNLLLARVYLLQGLRREDVVHSVYGFGMINGGHYIRETFLHFTECKFLPAGTGVETRSVQQIELMRDFRATVLVGFADYMRKLAQTAVEMDVMPGRDIPMRMISGHMGRESKKTISDMWGGADVYDWYGVGDTGVIAGEGPDHAGLYLMEDAHQVEIVDPETHLAVEEGMTGNLVDTVLFKHDVYPIIRFDTQDVTRALPGVSPLGINLRRIEGFLGRSDNMVKLRGINVYPHAIPAHLTAFPECSGEYVCRVERDATGRDELTVAVEVRGERSEALASRLREHLKARLGVDVRVALEPPDALLPLTQVESRQKAIRLIDTRFAR